MRRLFLTASVAAGLLASTIACQAAVRVVASIKPIHSLAAGLMQGVGEPALIVSGGASPHVYSLKPSQARALEDADVVFWVGEGLENFLEKPLAALAGEARVVALSETPDLTILKPREGGAFEAHHHDGEEEHAQAEPHHDGDHGEEDHEDGEHGEHHHEHEADMHLWLDPTNASLIVSEMEKTLIAADPVNEQRYKANAARMQARIEMLMEKAQAQVAPVSDRHFIVFHDAYHYFEHRFGLEAVGSITVSPETPPSAKRLGEIRERIAQSKVPCVFSEPQFPSAIVDTVLEGTGAHAGTLDPLGASLKDGPDLYFELIANMAASFSDCLSREN
ncbi:MAG: zinc ABC transporter substrate-binding protein ZnuA [Rhodobiaceae bacterium]|nr:zinc ABC transporter substrate-binding protein ZnuA [Rhodobiaceae bacterium]